MRWFETAPAAARLLRNLLNDALKKARPARLNAAHEPHLALLAAKGSSAERLAAAIGLVYGWSAEMDLPPEGGLAVVDPQALTPAEAVALHAWVTRGGTAAVLPAVPAHEEVLEILIGREVRLVEAPVYQLAPLPIPLMCGLGPYDLDWIEKVTYTPPPAANTVIADYALDIERVTPLLHSVHNPWEDFFVHGLDAEYLKMAVAARQRDSVMPYTYAAELLLGEGRVCFIQVRLLPERDKVRRLYSRFLANLGARIETGLLHTVKTQADTGLDALMALKREAHMDAAAILAYFTDPAYLLNNLGEGVFGWMRRIDRIEGALTIPGSAAGTWFLTVFIDSEANHDPARRPAGEVPDPSIVPDLYFEINCPFDLYVNGRQFAHAPAAPEGQVKVEDVLLRQGAGPSANRLVLVCQAGAEDIRLRAWFMSKFGEPLAGLKYRLTLD